MTARLAANPAAKASDLRTPGSTPAVVGAPGGTLQAIGYTEAALDLARLANSTAAVISEMLDADGRTTAADAVREIGAHREIPVVSVPGIARYRVQHEEVIQVSVRIQLPTAHGSFEAVALTSPLDREPYLALIAAGGESGQAPVVSIHRSCLGDAFRSRACDCRERIDRALAMIARHGGVIVHLPRIEAHDLRPSSEAAEILDDAELSSLILRALGIRRTAATMPL